LTGWCILAGSRYRGGVCCGLGDFSQKPLTAKPVSSLPKVLPLVKNAVYWQQVPPT
jgi:hypothetical protein